MNRPLKGDEPLIHRVQSMLSDAELKRLDDWAWERRIRSRSDAIRQLIERGFTVADEAPAKPATAPKKAPKAEARGVMTKSVKAAAKPGANR